MKLLPDRKSCNNKQATKSICISPIMHIDFAAQRDGHMGWLGYIGLGLIF